MLNKQLKPITLNADLREFNIEGKKALIGVASGRSLLKLTMPNKPNSREYMGSKNKNVRNMIKTLKRQPELFFYMNNGIHILADSYIRNDDGTYTIFFDKDDGIYNGNHTMVVLSMYGREKSHVIMAIFFDASKEHIAEITVAKNSSNPTKEISRGEKLGKYEWVKKILPEYPIKYKESDEYEVDISTILHIAGIYQVDKQALKFTNQDYRKFQSYMRRKGDIVKKNNDETLVLDYTRYILKDLIDYFLIIRADEECVSLMKKRLLNNGWIRKGYISTSLMMNLINALNFAFYIHHKTQYPCYKNGYNIERLIQLTKQAFPQIIERLKTYEEEGINVTEICRENSLYLEIQNIMAVTDLNKNNSGI